MNDPFILAFTYDLHLSQISQQTENFRNIFVIGDGFLFGDGPTVFFYPATLEITWL
jgi:hypothetical protein